MESQTIKSQFHFDEAFKNLVKFRQLTENKYPDVEAIYIRKNILKGSPVGLKVTIEVLYE